MSVALGNNNSSTFFIGNNIVSKIYLGETIIYSLCSDNLAGVIMVGWESGTRCLDSTGGGCGSFPTGFLEPYQTHIYGDETVVYEDGVWKYKNLSTTIVQSTNGPEYPWEANWPSPYIAYKWCLANQYT